MTASPAIPAPVHRSRGVVTTTLDALARIPIPVVAAALLLGAILADVQTVWIAHVHESGAAEPPQWLSRTTVAMVNILVPVGLIALWARRRSTQRRLGAVAAVLLTVLPVVHVVLTVGSLVWGLILGRGDMTYPFMYIEYLGYLSYLGMLAMGVSFLLDRGVPWATGPLIALGLIANMLVPWGFTIVYAALAVLLIATRMTRRIPSKA